MRKKEYHKLTGPEHWELLDAMLTVTKDRRTPIKSLLRLLPVTPILSTPSYFAHLYPLFMQRLTLGYSRRQDLYHFKPSYPLIPDASRLNVKFIHKACEIPM